MLQNIVILLRELLKWGTEYRIKHSFLLTENVKCANNIPEILDCVFNYNILDTLMPLSITEVLDCTFSKYISKFNSAYGLTFHADLIDSIFYKFGIYKSETLNLLSRPAFTIKMHVLDTLVTTLTMLRGYLYECVATLEDYLVFALESMLMETNTLIDALTVDFCKRIEDLVTFNLDKIIERLFQFSATLGETVYAVKSGSKSFAEALSCIENLVIYAIFRRNVLDALICSLSTLIENIFISLSLSDSLIFAFSTRKDCTIIRSIPYTVEESLSISVYS